MSVPLKQPAWPTVVLMAAETTEFRTALHDHAWMHYLELQDEL